MEWCYFPMSHWVGLDYGTSRIGIAVADVNGGMALPLTTIDARGSSEADSTAVLATCTEYEIHAFVVGLPYNMDGSEGPQAKLTRRFGEALRKTSGHLVHFWDERLSSFAAEEALAERKLTRKRRRKSIDRIAAQGILQEFLAAQSNSEVPDA